MKGFNLSQWALEHRAFTGFLITLVLLGDFSPISGWNSGRIQNSPSA